MIVRKRTFKNLPKVEFSLTLALQPKDVKKALAAYYKRCSKDIPTFDSYVYEDEEIEHIITTGTVIHHFTPAVKKTLLDWCMSLAVEKGYITPTTKDIAYNRGCTVAYTLNLEKVGIKNR